MVLPILAVTFIAGCFIATAKVGHRMPYSDDDMMNLYQAWIVPPLDLLSENLTLAPGRRSFGGAFYRIEFALFGFRSRPLNVAVWALLALNLWLAWKLFRQLGAEPEAAFLGVAILALHGGLRNLSFYTGSLFDTLCFTLYVSALWVYLRARARGVPGWRSLLLFTLLFVCALNSKEMAVSLPAIIFLWEITFQPPESWNLSVLGKRLTGEWRGVVLSAGIAAIFSIRALSSQSASHGYIAYTPVVTWDRWLETTATYLSFAFYGVHAASAWAIAAYGLALGAAAVSVPLRLRSFAAFAVLWFPITLLPISFVPPRISGYVLYIPMLLWALYAGTLLAQARARIASPKIWATGISRGLMLIALAAAFGALNRLRPNDPPKIEDSDEERTARQFKQMYPTLQGPTRLLFLHDAFKPDTFALLFTLRLLYRNPAIEVHRLSAPDDRHPPVASLPHYDHIFTYAAGRYIELDNTDTQTTLALRLRPGQSLGEYLIIKEDYIDPYVVQDVLEGDGDGRWTGAEPEFRFKLKSKHDRRLVAKFLVSDVTLQQNGPKLICWLVNGHELTRTRYEREGVQRVSFVVPEAWLSTEGLVTVALRVENPYIAEDQVKLGVVVMEVGFQ